MKSFTLLKVTAKAFMAVFILLIFLIIMDQVQAATYYIDFENGNDANDGLSPSSPKRHHPFDEDKGWAITDNTGHTIYLKKGVIYRGQLNLSDRNGASASDRLTTTYADSFGTGKPPELRGTSVYTGWTQDAIYTNTYKKNISAVAGSILFLSNSSFGVWEDDAYVIGVSSLADCNNTPGTFYFDGYDYIYIHTFETDDPDEHTIEATDKDYGVRQWDSQYITFQGITFSRYRIAGAATFEAAGDTAFNYCIFRDNDTGVIANGDTDLNNITVIRNLFRGIHVNNSTADVVLKNSLIAANAVNSYEEGVAVFNGSLQYGNNNIVGNGARIYRDVVGAAVDLGGNISQTPNITSDFSSYSYLSFTIDDGQHADYVYSLAQSFNSATGGNVPLTHYFNSCDTYNLRTYSKPAHDEYDVEIANHTEGHTDLSLSCVTIQFKYTGGNPFGTVEATASDIIFRDSATTTKSLTSIPDLNTLKAFHLPGGWEMNHNTANSLDLDIVGIIPETDAKNSWVDMNVTIEDYFNEEVVEQNDCIETEIGVRPVSLAYPNGAYSFNSDTYLANTGIESARTTQESFWLDHNSTHKVDLYYLGNIGIGDYPINSLSRAEAWGHHIAAKLNLFPSFLTPHWYSNSDVSTDYADDFLQIILDNTNASVDTVRNNVDRIKLNGTASSNRRTYTRKIPVNTLDLGDDCDVSDPGTLWYLDADGDGCGNPAVSVQQCTRPAGYVLDNADCDDTNSAINPNILWYLDADGDGYGNPVVSVQQCTQPAGYVLDNTDCDDNAPLEHPNQTWYLDADGDRYSDGTDGTASCAMPLGYTAASELIATSGDCDDTNAVLNPATHWYPDSDGDGFGNPSVSIQQCEQPTGPPQFVLNNADCDDNAPGIGWPLVRILGAAPACYLTLQDAYNNTRDGDIIQVQAATFLEDLSVNLGKSVAIKGGYDRTYTTNFGNTTLNGDISTANGTLIIENFVLQ
ncbi:MAG: hypothetical protein HZB61_05480 [Nitrospirae bacterium]|nr:hypothetical protein [Nitrospirota bacterium]